MRAQRVDPILERTFSRAIERSGEFSNVVEGLGISNDKRALESVTSVVDLRRNVETFVAPRCRIIGQGMLELDAALSNRFKLGEFVQILGDFEFEPR